jgi:hypothetical protein
VIGDILFTPPNVSTTERKARSASAPLKRPVSTEIPRPSSAPTTDQPPPLPPSPSTSKRASLQVANNRNKLPPPPTIVPKEPPTPKAPTGHVSAAYKDKVIIGSILKYYGWYWRYSGS